VVREYLGLARTAREADRLLSEKHVLVDGRVRKDPKFPVGLMDVVQFPALNKSYRVLFDTRGRLVLHEISQEEARFKLCKVIKKSKISGARIQLTFNDGKTLAGDFGEFKPRDTAKLSLPDHKILERIAFDTGTVALVTGGANVGKVGKIVEVKMIEGTQPNMVTLEAPDGTTFQTSEDYVFVVGKEKPIVTLAG
jgi:small subunit ribosomal protein S4e